MRARSLERYVGTLPSEPGGAGSDRRVVCRVARLRSRDVAGMAARARRLARGRAAHDPGRRFERALRALHAAAVRDASNVEPAVQDRRRNGSTAAGDDRRARRRRSATRPRSSGSTARRPGPISIEYEARGRVERLAASHVVLAIPLSTLRQIEFRPRLSAAKEKAIGAVAYYPGVRILLQSRDRFWNRAGLNGSARTARAEIWDCRL